MKLTTKEALFLTALVREQNQTGCKGPAHDLLRRHAYPDAPTTGPGSLAFSAVPLTSILLKDCNDLQEIDDLLRKQGRETNPEWPCRARSLHPSNDPLGAVDNLMALPQTARLTAGFSGDRGVLRRQGWRMIKDLTRQPEGRFDFLPYPGYDANTDWAQRKKIAAKIKIAWDDQRQAYVAR